MADPVSNLSHLCDVCSIIDFALYFQPPLPGEVGSTNDIGEILYKEKQLGLRADIRRKGDYCGFCQFAYTATNEVGDDTTISMSSIYCGTNRDIAGKDMVPTYYISVISDPLGPRTSGYIQLLEDDACVLGLSRDFLAREPRREGFNMTQARKWLDMCQVEHGESCNAPEGILDDVTSSAPPSDLLAIDLISMSICSIPPRSEYVALSYCWPATAYLTLKRESWEMLSKHGALLENEHKLPGTVQDAIKCAQELPFQYLWIDALCIIQDDDDHRNKQLRQMDRIYSCASLTLVCAYPVARGSIDPCNGFPGLKKHNGGRDRNIQLVNGLRMMVASPSIDEYLQRTRWNTRCWTFQEHMLSRRLLYFTPIQIYFQCSCSVFCEDTVGENISPTAYIEPGNTIWNTKSRNQTSEARGSFGGWDLSRRPLHTLYELMESYEMALTRYTYREVSYQADILNAFEGVKAVLSNAMNTQFWQGIPENILVHALCWQLRGDFQRRRNRPAGQPPSKPLFPSWTWAGWDSRINLNMHMAIRAYRSDAEWYIINNASVATRLVVHPEGNSLESQRLTASSLKTLLPQLALREEVDASSPEWRDARTLACWTTRAFFEIDGSRHQLDTDRHERQWPKSTNFAIKDSQRITAGCILLPKDFVEKFGTDSVRCEFILISRSLPSQRTKMSYFNEAVYAPKDWCHLNVMLISRPAHLGQYEALRIGVGIIHHDAWTAARPETDFVKLV